MTPNKVSITALVTALLLVACASLNPLAHAESAEQKAYALYGMFVVFEEQAAKVYKDPLTPQPARQALSEADRVAKPAVDAVIAAAREVIALRRDYAAGATDKEKLLAAIDHLNHLVEEATPAVNRLITVVKER